LLTNGSWEFFFSAAPTAQNTPELHFRFINSFIQPSRLGSLGSGLAPIWSRISSTEYHNINHFSLYYAQVINYGATWYGKRLFSYAYDGKQLAGKM
jgi:hypothetical protein